jgi:hypothetical protein
MNMHVFNICLALGWIMATAGGMLLNPGAGLLGGGLLLLALTLLVARMGGVMAPAKDAP